MKVAYLMHGLGWGGAAGSLLLLLKSLRNYPDVEKHLITTIDKDFSVKEEFKKNVVSYDEYYIRHIYNDQAGGRTDEKELKNITEINLDNFIKKLKKLQIEILHVNSSVLPQVVKQVKEKTEIKVVVHLREMIPKYDNGLVQSYMLETIEHYADIIICISDNEFKQLKCKENAVILTNPFDFEALKLVKSDFRTEHNISKSTILIGMAGNFSYSRGHLFFLKVINKIVEETNINPDELQFIIAGTSFNPWYKVLIKRMLGRKDYGDEYLRYLKKNKLSKFVYTTPYLPHSKYFELLRCLDIFVRPSLAGDPWGRDIIEAMAFSKPIIATGTSDYLVKPNINGQLVNAGDIDELTEAIKGLMKDVRTIEEYGKRSYVIIYDKSNLNNYGSKIYGLYKEILNEK
jgi:glycosyltransferase involved in cell wall biosynthesis